MSGSKFFVSVLCITALLFGFADAARAEYPVSNVTLITHSSPGSGTDVFLRNAIKYLHPIMGTNFVVENVRGGSGAKALAKLATSPADGSIFYGSTPTFLMTPLVAKTEYTYKDLEPVVNVFSDPMLLYTNADSPFKTLEEAVEFARDNPGKGRWGMGNPLALDRKILETLKKMGGVDKVAITSFEGGGDLLLSVMGGNFDLAVGETAEVQSQVEAGKLRILAYLSKSRVDLYPDVPTAQEQGYDLVLTKFRGIVGPKGLPKDVVKAWEEAIPKLLATPEYKAEYTRDALIPDFMPQAECNAYIEDYANGLKLFLKEMGVIK